MNSPVSEGPVRQRIQTKLTAAFAPEHLEIEDESHKHAGHVGARPEGETHFHVTMTAEAFAGQTRVTRQREVYRVLAEELAGPVHALGLTLKAPGDS